MSPANLLNLCDAISPTVSVQVCKLVLSATLFAAELQALSLTSPQKPQKFHSETNIKERSHLQKDGILTFNNCSETQRRGPADTALSVAWLRSLAARILEHYAGARRR